MTVVRDAIWSWWVQPVAVVDGARLWVGSITANGTNRLHRIVGETVDTVTLGGPESSDDHNGTAVALDPGRQQLLAFYARHNSDTHVRMRTVDRDSLVVGAEQQVDFSGNVTYAQVAIYKGSVWLWCRVGNTEWHYRRSGDWGNTWGPERTMFVRVPGTGSPGQIYMTLRQSGETVHFATVGHPSSSTWHTIGHCQASLASGQVTLADGTVLGNLEGQQDSESSTSVGPELTLDELGEVFDPPTGDSTRLLDVGVIGGRPAVAYATWTEPSDPATYRVARWGPGWSSDDVVASGEPFGYLPEAKYLGGAIFDGDDLITAREDAGTWRVERRPQALNWDVDEELASSSTPKLIRPAAAAGRIVWQRLHLYDSFTVYQADLEVLDVDAATDVDPGQSAATLRTRVEWLAFDTVSGWLIQELPSPQGGEIERVIGHATSAGLSFPVAELPPATWDQVDDPLRIMIVAVINDVPAWGGILLNPVDGSGSHVELACATPEVYLDHRYVGDHTWRDVDIVSTIAAGLVGDAQHEGIGFLVDAPAAGHTAERTYHDDEGETVLDALQELMSVLDGPEFTVDLEWADNTHLRILKVLRIRPRIGRDTDVIFETAGGADATYKRSRDFSDGRGANHVVAVSSGQGDDRPMSSPARDETSIATRGRWEHRFTPSTSIKRKATLNRHASAELPRRVAGSRTWDVTARWDAYPRYGIDWRLGDTVSWVAQSDRHPSAISGRGRTIGWKLDLESMLVTPKFQEG